MWISRSFEKYMLETEESQEKDGWRPSGSTKVTSIDVFWVKSYEKIAEIPVLIRVISRGF